jgi:hypothetical protein
MKLTPELVQSYYDAEFHVYSVGSNGGELILPSMGSCDALQALHNKYDVSSSALITAYNPHSEPTDESENEVKQRLLKADVSKHWEYLEAEGCDVDKRWCSEPSIYVLGINLQQVLELGRVYQQHAVLYAQGTMRGTTQRTISVNLYACDPTQQYLFKLPT